MGDKPRLALMSFVGVIAKTNSCEGISLKTVKRWICTKCCQGLLARYLSIMLVSFRWHLQRKNVYYDLEMSCFSLSKLPDWSVLEIVLNNTLYEYCFYLLVLQSKPAKFSYYLKKGLQILIAMHFEIFLLVKLKSLLLIL